MKLAGGCWEQKVRSMLQLNMFKQNFIYIRVMESLAVVYLTILFIHMCTNDDHKAL